LPHCEEVRLLCRTELNAWRDAKNQACFFFGYTYYAEYVVSVFDVDWKQCKNLFISLKVSLLAQSILHFLKSEHKSVNIEAHKIDKSAKTTDK